MVPALRQTEREYRAFELMDALPAGCIAFPVVNHDSGQHLRPGEFAVVDTADKEPRHLDVYVIQWNGGRRNVCQARKAGTNTH